MSGDSRLPRRQRSGSVESSSVEPPEPAPGQALATKGWSQITLEEVIRPVAIASMLACIAISLAQVVALIAPAWPGRFFVVLTFLVSLESIHAHRQLSRLGPWSRDRWRFRFVEWVIILLVVRIGMSLSKGPGGLAADVAAWSSDLGAFFGVSFLVGGALVALFWMVAQRLSRAMQELEATPIEREPSVTDPDFYLRSTMPHRGRTDRQARLNLIVSTFFWGGAVLLILSGLTQVDVRELVALRHPRTSGVILNVLAYFIIGLLIVSQAQYAILKAGWDLERIPIQGKLGKRWILLALSFLLLVGLVSALLPVGYSVGLIQSLSAAVMWIGFALIKVVSLLLWVLSVLLSLLMGRTPQSPPNSPTQPSPVAPTPPVEVANEAWPWWGLVRSLVFWLALTGVAGYSLFHFLRDRWGLFRGISLARFLAWVAGVWQALRSGTRHTASRIRQGIARRLASRRPREKGRAWRYISLRRLSPRDRVRYYYLSILRRSARQGFARPQTATPLEYQATLIEQLPEAADQVAQLSWAFVEARYSEHLVSGQDAKGVRGVWRLVKKALTSRRRSPDRGAPSPSASKEPRS